MPNKNHLRIIPERQMQESGAVKFNYGFASTDDENTREPNYNYMARVLRRDLRNYESDVVAKIEARDVSIDVPHNVDYVEIEFMGQFHLEEYYEKWYNTFGLEGVRFTEYNRKGLFAIADREKFANFIASVQAVILKGTRNAQAQIPSRYVLFVKHFELLTSADIIQLDTERLGNVVMLKTIELPANTDLENEIINALEAYLIEQEISHTIDREVNRIELYDMTAAQLFVIAQNFDIIESATSSLTGVVRPGIYNVVKRGAGFEIANSDQDLPIIGILDTGISMETPLASITINDDSFSLDGSPLIDTFDRDGHGTMVGALASLGKYNHQNEFQGEVNADAKLLSIKLLADGRGYLSENKVIKLLRAAKDKYPEMMLFVLTICYTDPKHKNQPFSNYTFELDKFAHETNSLIFISTGNNDMSKNENTDYDLEYFNNDSTNLSTPADSMNNMTVGAAADGLYDGAFNGISMGKEYPTIFSRKDATDLAAIYPSTKKNRNLFKPDVIESGGDYGFYRPNTIDFMDNAAISVLSNNPARGYMKEVGTSLSAPLIANLAAKLKIVYPEINAQTIKALIINSASLERTIYPENVNLLLNRTAGYGVTDIDKALFSNENGATLILEDSINSDEQKIYPINFPEYLLTADLGKKRGILKVTGTLCFSFLPLQHNQLTYCPIHMAFSVFRNHTSDQINSKDQDLNSKLRTGQTWSQSARAKKNPVPYSNVQKIEFNINFEHLRDEDQVLKLAVQSRLSNQIMPSQVENYPTEYNFSLVLKIEETVRNNTGRLYDELRAINNLEIINNVENEIDLEGEI